MTRRHEERTTGGNGRTTTRRALMKAAGATVAATGLGAVGTAAGADVTPRLHTDGRWIKDPTDSPVRLRGVATADPGFYARSWHPKSPEAVVEWATDEQRGWHPNHVRLPITQSSIDHHGGIDAFVTDYLRPIVDLLGARDVYALVDFHLIRPYTQAATESHNQSNKESEPDFDPIDDVMRNFWSRVAPEFAEDSHVIYELFNEPTAPKYWSDDEQAWLTWRDAAQPWVDLVQEHAPATPLVIGSPRWTSVTNMAPEFPFDGDNLIYAGHIYPKNGFPNSSDGPRGTGPFDPTYGQPANEVPVWITEFGWEPDGGNVDRGKTSGWGSAFREWVESYENVSWSAWCFDDSWAPTMFSSPTNDSSEPWTLKDGAEEHGGYVKTWLAETRDQQTPSLPVDDSHPPATPEDLTVERATEISATVTWSAVTDDGGSGLSHYVVSRDGQQVQTVAAGSTRARLTGLSPASTYEVGVSAVDRVGNESPVATATVETIARDANQSAYAEHTVPGTIRAEAFDVGGQGIAYYDSTPGNAADGDARPETDVDVGTSDPDGQNVGYVTAGEWLEYTVTVEQAGTYEVSVRSAASGSGGGNVRVVVDGDQSVSKDLWPTGGWSTFQEIPVGELTLTGGTHVVRVVAESGGWNFDELRFAATDGPTPTDPGDEMEPVMEGRLPQDVDADGHYEDVTGDGELDFNDLVAYYQHKDDPAMAEHVDAYDYTGDGQLDFNDLVALYQEM